jgi:plasmid replication initiation protein
MNYNLTVINDNPSSRTKNKKLMDNRWYFICKNEIVENHHYSDCQKYTDFYTAIQNYNNQKHKLISTTTTPTNININSYTSYIFKVSDIFFYN